MDSDVDDQYSESKASAKTWKEKLQFFLSMVFLALVLLGLFVVITLRLTPATQERRCKCVCSPNVTVAKRYNQTVFQREVDDASKCTCGNIVPDADDITCLQCCCEFQLRNSLLIKMINVSVTVAIVFLILVLFVAVIVRSTLWTTRILRSGLLSHRRPVSEVGMPSINNQKLLNSRQRRLNYHTFQ